MFGEETRKVVLEVGEEGGLANVSNATAWSRRMRKGSCPVDLGSRRPLEISTRKDSVRQNLVWVD